MPPPGAKPCPNALQSSLLDFDEATQTQTQAHPLIYIQVSDAERFLSPILPGHEAYSAHMAGTYRVPGGGLNSQAGTIEVIDTLLSKYVTASGLKDIEQATAEVKKAANDLKGRGLFELDNWSIRSHGRNGKNLRPAPRKDLDREQSVLRVPSSRSCSSVQGEEDIKKAMRLGKKGERIC
ncbi:hypothetical protein AYL99_11736 [Fonsecaea erecta]|uniref:Uncharacterized protein n=1 Tax=Fonsecaea erecta TaxID=1367422 RepID=A0A178Z3T1_9EURO|nr:hypothetical protein AYL99_11736 [Fonsecaea erecta]OAP54201.1 hypothetical protein AYL99_11736 [Fonsecaea erecta]